MHVNPEAGGLIRARPTAFPSTFHQSVPRSVSHLFLADLRWKNTALTPLTSNFQDVIRAEVNGERRTRAPPGRGPLRLISSPHHLNIRFRQVGFDLLSDNPC